MVKCLNILSKHHKEWISIVRSFGEYNYAEDIVQEMYIQIHKYRVCDKVIVSGDINRAYIWIMLKNSFIAIEKERAKAYKVSINDIMTLEDTIDNDYEMHESKHIIHQKVINEISTWHHYEKQLFELHMINNHSMRKISKGSKISLSSIFNTIKNCKIRLNEAIGEDVEDMFNGEHQLIK